MKCVCFVLQCECLSIIRKHGGATVSSTIRETLVYMNAYPACMRWVIIHLNLRLKLVQVCVYFTCICMVELMLFFLFPSTFCSLLMKKRLYLRLKENELVKFLLFQSNGKPLEYQRDVSVIRKVLLMMWLYQPLKFLLQNKLPCKPVK